MYKNNDPRRCLRRLPTMRRALITARRAAVMVGNLVACRAACARPRTDNLRAHASSPANSHDGRRGRALAFLLSGVEEIPVPEAAADEVRIAVGAASVCVSEHLAAKRVVGQRVILLPGQSCCEWVCRCSPNAAALA